MKKLKNKKDALLIILCWVVYTCSYLGKLGYNANIIQIELNYGVSHYNAGLVSTFFFFAYGIGQVVNGFFCKKYNVRLMVTIGLLVSGVMNLLVGVIENFNLVKYFWLINGFSLSFLWPSLIRLLSETLDKKNMGKAVLAMGTTVATGTFFVYGLSALFVKFSTYKVMFVLSGILLPSIAIFWYVLYSKLIVKDGAKSCSEQGKERNPKNTSLKGVWLTLVVLAIFSVSNNFVKDGLTTWVPTILKETYNLEDSISILLTVLLPLLAVFGASVVVLMNKRVKNFVILSSILFLISATFITISILCLPLKVFIITLLCFGGVALLMSGVNNVVTSMAPLNFRDRLNSGKMAGLLNGFCYLGSAVSSFLLGAIADCSGWNVVVLILNIVCISMAIIGCIYSLIKKKA